MKFLAIILLAAILGGCVSAGAYGGYGRRSGGHYGVGVGVGI